MTRERRQATVRAGVAVALVLSLLAATAPITTATDAADLAAASDGLVVGSQHTTGADYQSAQTLENLTVEGSGESATVSLQDVSPVVESFEDGFGTYGGDTSAASQDSSTLVKDGDVSGYLDHDATGGQRVRISDTDYNYKLDDTYTGWIEISGSIGKAGFQILTQEEDNSPGGYLLWVSADANEIHIYRDDGSGGFTKLSTSSVTITANTEYQAEWSVASDGTILFRLLEKSGAELASVQATDTTYQSGGIGFHAYDGDAWFDAVANENVSEAVEGAQYVSGIHNVTGAQTAAINITRASNVSVDATIRTDGGTALNQTTLSGTGNHTLALNETSNSRIETILDVNVTGSNPAFSLADESILFTNHAPNASELKPADGTTLNSSSVDFSANITDEEFGTAQGDTVDATLFIDNESVATTTISSNQTVTFTEDLGTGGDHEYYWRLNDSYGESTTTPVQTVTTPGQLYVRNVSAPSQLVEAGNATVTFYGGQNEETIVERELSNGTVSLSNLPVDEEFTVVVDAEGYFNRQVILRSIFEQSSIYMLSSNKSNVVEITFQLNDKTGRFSGDETQLFVQRPITLNNSTNWRTVIADDISASNELSTLLENNQRYRLVVSNGQETRILGAYTPTGPADPEVIPIGEIDIGGDAEANGTVFGATAAAGENKTDNTTMIRAAYRDPSETTESIRIRVYNSSDAVLYDATTTGTFGTLKESIPLNTTDNELRVVYNATRESGEVSGTVYVGMRSCTWCIDAIPTQILHALEAVSLVAVIGLTALQDGALAGAVGVVWGAILVITLGAPILNVSIGLGIGYATVFLVGRGGGG